MLLKINVANGGLTCKSTVVSHLKQKYPALTFSEFNVYDGLISSYGSNSLTKVASTEHLLIYRMFFSAICNGSTLCFLLSTLMQCRWWHAANQICLVTWTFSVTHNIYTPKHILYTLVVVANLIYSLPMIWLVTQNMSDDLWMIQLAIPPVYHLGKPCIMKVVDVYLPRP